MKPIIIQVPSTKDGKVTLTVKELQEMLDKAYESGKKDGTTNLNYCPSTCPYRPWWYGNSYTTYTNTTGTGTDSSITWTSTNTSNDATISLNNCKTGHITSCTS